MSYAGYDDIRGLLSQFQPSEEEKRAAKMAAIAQLGLGLLGTPKGQEFARLGQAGMGAMAGYQGALQDSRAQKMQGMQAAQQAMQLQEMERQAKLREQQAQQDAAWQAKLPGLLSGPSPADVVGSGAPTNANAQALQSSGPPKKWQVYQHVAEQALAMGRPDAPKWMELADKFRPKVKSQDVRLEGGVPVVVITYEDGTQTKSAYNPTPNTEMVNLGDRTVAVDKNTTAPGTSMAFGQSPDSKASNALGWANYKISAAREGREAAKSTEPAWVNDLDRGIQIDPRSGQSRPIMAGGNPVGAKGETKQAEQSKRALQIIDQAEPLIKKATGSYLGAGADVGAQAFGFSTPGATATAQLKALEGALMLNQPRMEGPQSDRDTALYRQMAAQIGDPTVPQAQKLAALKTIRTLHQQYMAGGSGATGGVQQPQRKVVNFADLP